jgi:hypothetical protein
MTDDGDPLLLRLADPLPGRLAQAPADRLLVTAREWQAHPVAGRLDLLDLVEPEGGERAG